MTAAKLTPYDTPRNLDQDAWYLYQITAISHYELCARLCDEFAEIFNTYLTGHGLHGAARLDYWVSRYLTHAENIRRGIGFIKNGGDYMPMVDILNAAAADYRGLVEQPLGWMSDEQRKQWDHVFGRLSYACGIGSTALRNNLTKGIHWLNRRSIGKDQVYLDRDDSNAGDAATAIQSAEKYGVISAPSSFPTHPVDVGQSVCPGERCPRTGVWVPKQWLDGATDFSLAFGVEGRPMQPAYRIKGLELNNPFIGYDEEMAAEYEAIATGLPVTEAVDTIWYFVTQPIHKTDSIDDMRLRCEAGQPCPKTGHWITPARAGSRRYFQQGTTMPEVASDYGSTIWQWDSDQSDPNL